MSWAVFPHQTVSSQRFFRLRGNFFVPTPEAQEELFPPCFQNQKDEIKYQPGFTPISPPIFLCSQPKEEQSPPIFLCSQPKEEQSITRSEPEMIREQNGNKAVITWE